MLQDARIALAAQCAQDQAKASCRPRSLHSTTPDGPHPLLIILLYDQHPPIGVVPAITATLNPTLCIQALRRATLSTQREHCQNA